MRGAALALLAVAALLTLRDLRQLNQPGDQQSEGEPAEADAESYAGGTVVADFRGTDAEIMSTVQRWTAPAAAGPYLQAIGAAERTYGLPVNLLARLLWQESRYRPDVIDGRTRSPVGAAGIAQFMPATAREFGIDPLDPYQSIDAAGRYLRQLYRRFGNWREALAAYNWGQGNVSRRGLDRAPLETRNYFAAILGDLGLSA